MVIGDFNGLCGNMSISLKLNKWKGKWRSFGKFLTLLQKRRFIPVRKPRLSRFPNRECQAGIKGGALLSRVWQPGQKAPFCPDWCKGAASATCLAHPFVPVGVTNRDKRSIFFLFLVSQLFFYFDYTFTFQLNLCIGIQYVRSPLIYTYIYSYLYNICPR